MKEVNPQGNLIQNPQSQRPGELGVRVFLQSQQDSDDVSISHVSICAE